MNIGGNRKDVNHVNAVKISDSGLLVGLNNRGVEDSCILHIPCRYLYSEGLCFDALSVSRRTNLESITDTHDLELIDGRFICCASKDGRVIDANTKETIYKDNGWVRGITFDEEYIYVGVSQIAARAKRHKHVMSPKVVWLSRSDYSYEGEQIISQGGQVNDLLHIADPKIR